MHDPRPSTLATASDARGWVPILARYRLPCYGRGSFEIAITLLPLAGFWFLMWLSLHFGFWPGLILALPAGAFLLRLFAIQHDCSHGSFFAHRRANEWVGRIIGVLTLTPFALWQRMHAIHHAGAGSLDRRGAGDIMTLTVDEYHARSFWGRLSYRLYRHPLVMFGIGPAYMFIFQQRLPIGMMDRGRFWASTMGTNLSIVLTAGTVIWFIGIQAFLLLHLPVVLIAATAGIWLFFVQHQFEEVTWEKDANWNWHLSALHGSSHYDLPGIMRWFTANIGIHHVHHLCSHIPFYRLHGVLKDYPELHCVGRLTLMDSLACVKLVLWDEKQRCLVSFRDAPMPA